MRTRLIATVLGLTLLFGVLAPPASAANVLKADYRLRGTLASAVAGAPNLKNLAGTGPNQFAMENVDGVNRQVLQFTEGGGVRLPNPTSIVPAGRYTIAVYLRLDEVLGYQRILTFKPDSSSHSDTGLYVDDGDLEWYPRTDPHTAQIDVDEWVLVVLTRSANGVLRGYVDGNRRFAIVDGTLATLGASLRFFQDDSNNEDTSGAVARIRLWNYPLSQEQVQALH